MPPNVCSIAAAHLSMFSPTEGSEPVPCGSCDRVQNVARSVLYHRARTQMQTRKLSVKAFYDLTPAEGLRVCFVIHTPTEL